MNMRYMKAAACFGAALMAVSGFTCAHGLFRRNRPCTESFSKTSAPGQVMTFEREDFQRHSSEKLSGIIVTALPQEEDGVLVHSGEKVNEGKVIAAESLGALSFVPAASGRSISASFRFIPVFSGQGAGDEAVTAALNISDTETPPLIALDGKYETYGDMPLKGRLRVSEQGNGKLTYEIRTEPRCGSLICSGDSFVYTPERKADSDFFTFRVCDERGLASGEARVDISILKRQGEECFIYDDMKNREGHFAAVRLAEEGIMRGETAGTGNFLHPDEALTRAELTAMVSKLRSIPLSEAGTVTELEDGDLIPQWARPCISAAFQQGIVKGDISPQGGRIFRASDPVTRAEAAVILDRALRLADDGRDCDFTDSDAVPSWAAQAAVNTVAAGYINKEEDGGFAPSEPFTRGEAAMSLCRAMENMRSRDRGFFGITGR